MPRYSDRALPHSVDAEQSILGAVLKNPKALIESGMPSEDYFYSPKHRTIWSAMLMLHQSREVVDVVSVSNELRLRGDLDKIGGRVYLVDLMGSVVSIHGLQQWVEILTEKYQLRQLIAQSHELENGAYRERDPGKILAETQTALAQVGRHTVKQQFIKIGQAVPKVTEFLNRVASDGRPVGIATGIEKLDELTGGLQRGDLSCLAARPSMGKTALMNCIASEVAGQGVPVGVFSAETALEEYTLRSLCTAAELNSIRLKRGQISERDFQVMAKPIMAMEEWPYWINPTPSIDVNVLVSEAARLKSEHDVQIVFIDYLQRVTSKAQVNKREKVDLIVNTLKDMALSLNISVVVLSQLNRELERRKGDKRPKLSDLKESGEIEQTSDVVMFLYRHELYCKKSDVEKHRNQAEIIVAKQRNGPIGVVECQFWPEYTKFITTSQEDLTL